MALNLLLLGAAGCATTFTGSAMVEGGRSGCERKCSTIGLQMQAFVFMGEYSSACVCEAAGKAASAADASPASTVAMLWQLRNPADAWCIKGDCGHF
ncbi:MAG TPA: hypothetical protein VJR89_04550 [Polyangiales bacterium]|nr:hypothetical protein [Polyangiales bacterium]